MVATWQSYVNWQVALIFFLTTTCTTLCLLFDVTTNSSSVWCKFSQSIAGTVGYDDELWAHSCAWFLWPLLLAWSLQNAPLKLGALSLLKRCPSHPRQPRFAAVQQRGGLFQKFHSLWPQQSEVRRNGNRKTGWCLMFWKFWAATFRASWDVAQQLIWPTRHSHSLSTAAATAGHQNIPTMQTLRIDLSPLCAALRRQTLRAAVVRIWYLRSNRKFIETSIHINKQHLTTRWHPKSAGGGTCNTACLSRGANKVSLSWGGAFSCT